MLLAQNDPGKGQTGPRIRRQKALSGRAQERGSVCHCRKMGISRKSQGMVSCPVTVVVMPSDCSVFRVKEASVWTRKQELRQARDDQAAEAECHTEAAFR